MQGSVRSSLAQSDAGVEVSPERLLHTPLDSLAQADAQDGDKQKAEDMQVYILRLLDMLCGP